MTQVITVPILGGAPPPPPPSGPPDDFNRSNRVLGGDNGWTAWAGVMEIQDQQARATALAGDHDLFFVLYAGSWAGVYREAAPLTGGVWNGAIDVHKTATGWATGLLALGCDAAGTEGMVLVVDAGGSVYVQQYFVSGGSPTYASFGFLNNGAMKTAPIGTVVRYHMTYDPATGAVHVYQNGVDVMSVTSDDRTRPMGPYIGFATMPDTAGDGSFTCELVFDNYSEQDVLV